MMRCVWVSISTLLLFSLRPTVGSIEAGLEGARPLTSIRVAVVHGGVTPIASSKNTVVFYGEFCVIAARVGPQIGSNAYRE